MSDMFHDMERLNIEFDILIDAEEYEKLYKSIILEDAASKGIKNFFADNGSHIYSNDDEDLASLLEKPETIVESYKRENKDDTEIPFNPDDKNEWDPLFLAKYLRAKILDKGTDNYTKYLDDLVTYLQRKLPYLSPKTTKESILQSLYFQELSACGKPGREALGFAIQAYDLLGNKNDVSIKEDKSHYNLELYKLCAKYNQGIGYSHSNQHEEATSVFDEIIRRFSSEKDDLFKNKADPKDKGLWRHFLYYPTILSKAELLEDFQFSYHTIATVEELKEELKEQNETVTGNDEDGPKLSLENIFQIHNECMWKNQLIKEALAYRDMGRLKEAKDKILELLFGEDCNNIYLNKIKECSEEIEEYLKEIKIFFDSVEEEIKKKNIKSKTLGLLFDYFLSELEQNHVEESDSGRFKNVSIELISQLKNQLPGTKTSNDSNAFKLFDNKQDRTSYYQQSARFLKILSDRLKKTEGEKERKEYFEKIRKLYEELKEYLLPDSKDFSEENYRLNLKDLGKYDYNRYTESMEKFYRNLTSCGFTNYSGDEKKLLEDLNNFERQKSMLYKFKELERQQRINQINQLKNIYSACRHFPSCNNCFDGLNKNAFDGVLKCCSPTCCSHGKNESNTKLIAEDYENIMARENERFLDYLKHKSNHPVYHCLKGKVHRSFHFMGLQRWNSQTPTLTLSQGGGYLLYEQDENGDVILGIAIDPGFDFVDNLFHMGFTLNDIDFILLSHAHLDHIRDFEPIISSLLDLHKRNKGAKKKIHAVMTWGVYDKLKHVITSPSLREFLADTYIVDINKDIKPEKKPEGISFRFTKDEDEKKFTSIISDDHDRSKYIEIKPTYAYHNDFSEISDSYGYIVDFYGNEGNNNNVGNEPIFSFGYTGDTKWHDSIPESYKGCDGVCIHIGALIESENGKKNKFEHYKGPQCDALIEKKQHPYLFGLLRYLKKIQEHNSVNKNKLLLISEFGEELKGSIRIDFIRRLNELLKNGSESPVCLPVDIGLNVVLASQIENKESKNKKWEREHKVWCYGCEKFVDRREVGYRHFSHGNNDEALFYFCNTCLKSKPENFFQNKMRLICEAGLPLEKAFENRKD